MKKSFALAFMFCAVVFCGVCGFFLLTQNNATVDITVAENIQDGYANEKTYKSLALDSGSNEPIAYFSNLGANNGYKNYTPTPYAWSYDHIIYDVVLMNFSDFSIFTESNYTEYVAKFDEASDYISTMSRGITKMEFNYYLYNNPSLTLSEVNNRPYNFSVEERIIEEGLSKGYCLSSCGKATCRIIMIAHEGAYGYKTMPHPHVWYSSTLYDRFMVVRSQTSADTLAHELLHTIGLTDLYNFDLYPMCVDIMCQEAFNAPVNPYSRYKLGWLDESFADDDIETAIETITQTGRYTLNNPFSQTGTISYKFGAKGSDIFYIEAEKKAATIYIHKVNTSKKDNVNAKTKKDLHVETVSYVIENHKSTVNTKITPTHRPLQYTNGTTLNVSIGNVHLEENGQISFDFFYGNSTNVEGCISVKDKQTNKPVANVDVYINDVYQSTTDEKGKATISATNSDILKLRAKNYLESEYYIISKALNLNTKGEFPLTIVAESTNDLSYKFEFSVKDKDCTYDVSPYDVTYSVNDEIVKYNFGGIYLAKNDVLKVSSMHFKPLAFRFTPFYLVGVNENVVMEDDTFHITAYAKTSDYYINLYNDNEDLAEISKVTAYNFATNTWENVQSVSVVYKYEVPYYQIENISSKYSRLAFEYTACGVTSSTIVFLENDKYEYRQKLDKTALQVAGDFITSIGTGIKDFFGKLFG